MKQNILKMINVWKNASQYYTKDENRNECILCNIREPYLQDGECVKEFNQFYKINHRNKTCINCQNNINETFLQNNESRMNKRTFITK